MQVDDVSDALSGRLGPHVFLPSWFMQVEDLSKTLGFRCAEHEIEGGRTAFLWGEIGECEVFIRFGMLADTPAPTFIGLSLYFMGGQDCQAIVDRIENDPEVKGLRIVGEIEFADDHAFEVTSESLKMKLGIERGILVCSPSGIAELIRAIARAASREAPFLPRVCDVCFAAEGVMQDIVDEQVSRLCLPCREEIARINAAAAGRRSEAACDTSVSVDSERFRARVAEFRKRHDEDPAAYWRWLVIWVILGQVGFVVVSAGLVIVAGLTVALILVIFRYASLPLLKGGVGHLKQGAVTILKLGVVALLALAGAVVLIWKLVQSLLSRPAPPSAEYSLTRSTAPRFLAWIDALADEMSAPHPDRVVLTRDLNASVSERERGYFGSERVLTIGLPVLECLDRDELRAVVAHEFGHLIHEDMASLWVYRTSGRWFEALEWFEKHESVSLVRRFVTWYAPEFILRAQVVSRRQELRADARAAAITSPALLISALTKMEVAGQLIDSAWRRALDQAASDVVPGDSRLLESYAQELGRFGEGRRRLAISDEMSRDPHWVDAHPSLDERARTLGVVLAYDSPPALTPSDGARDLLDDYRQHQAALEAEWRRNNVPELGHLRFVYRRQQGLATWAEAQLGSDAKAPIVALAARANRHIGRSDEAKRLYARVLSLDPTHLDARREALELHFESEDWPAAVEQAESLCRHERANASLWRFAASICEAAGRDARAGEIYNFLLECDPDPSFRRFLEKKLRWLEVR